MRQDHPGYAIFRYLTTLCLVTSMTLGCATDDTYRPATTFVYREAKVVGDKGLSVPPLDLEAQGLAAGAKPGAPYRLTLSEALVHALQQNKKIQVAAYNPPRAVEDLKGAQAVYDPSVFSSANTGHSKRPTQSVLDTGTILEDKYTENRWFLRGGLKKVLPSGATVSAYQELDRLKTNSTLYFPDPQNTSRAGVEVAQPLLRGFLDPTNRAAIKVAKLGVDISNEDFRQTVLDVVGEAVRTYWQLTMEREFVLVSQKILEMAEEVYRREHVRLEKGISTKLDAERARAAAESRRSDLLRGQNRIRVVSDQLKLILNLPAGFPEIIPLEKPKLKPITVDMGEAQGVALKNRPELEKAAKTKDVGEVRRDLASHNTLPKLDAVFRYWKAGLGAVPGSAFDTVYNSANNNWLASVEFEYPLGNRAPKAEATKRSLEYQQASADLNRVREQILSEVSLAVREIYLAQKEIPTTQLAKESSERVVASENARFELGQKTNEELLRAQDLLGAAERDYIRSVIEYNVALVMLGRAKGTLLKEVGIEIEK